MSNEQDLLKQLNDLPDGAKAPDRWSEIRQQIEAEASDNGASEKKQKPWWTMAIAASLLVTATLINVWLPETSQQTTQTIAAKGSEKSAADKIDVFGLTIQSLQQGNAAYYDVLGRKVKSDNAQLPKQTWASLESLRDAQQQYRKVLNENPDNGKAKQRLFWLYEKERDLLRQLVIT